MEDKPPADLASIGHLFSRLIDDAERFVRAEVSLYRAQIFARIGEAKIAIILVGTAFLIAQSAIIALVVGLILVVRQQIHSAAWATVIVVGCALTVAAILSGIAIGIIKRVTRIAKGPE